jgi:hypothetical protein
MASANFDHAPIASGDLDLLVEEGAREEAQEGARQKYGKVLLVAALVLSSFACGAAFAKNVSAVPARSSGDNGAVDLYTAYQFGADLSAYTAGKNWGQIASAYNEVAANNGADPSLAAMAKWLRTQPQATQKALITSLEASAYTAATQNPSMPFAMFGPLNLAYQAVVNGSNITNGTAR